MREGQYDAAFRAYTSVGRHFPHGESRATALGSVAVSRTAAPEPVLPRSKARAAKFSWLNESARNAASRQNGPGPSGCAGNLAMRCWRTWQGNNHSLRPPPRLARFLAATRLALKRQQTLACKKLARAVPLFRSRLASVYPALAHPARAMSRGLLHVVTAPLPAP